MRTITVNKAELMNTIRQNRDDHYDTFLTAQRVYRERVIATLDERLREAQRGGKIDIYIALPEPVNYTEDFDNAIAALEWEVGDTVTLTETEFKNFVLNQWGWAQHFAATTQTYVAG